MKPPTHQFRAIIYLTYLAFAGYAWGCCPEVSLIGRNRIAPFSLITTSNLGSSGFGNVPIASATPPAGRNRPISGRYSIINPKTTVAVKNSSHDDNLSDQSSNALRIASFGISRRRRRSLGRITIAVWALGLLVVWTFNHFLPHLFSSLTGQLGLMLVLPFREPIGARRELVNPQLLHLTDVSVQTWLDCGSRYLPPLDCG